MRFFLAVIFFAFLTSCSSAPQTPQSTDSVHYVIEPTVFEAKPALHFHLSFTGTQTGRTFLELPSQWASESDYFKDLKELKVITPKVLMENGAKPYIKILSHKPQEVIEISYILTEQKPHGDQPYRSLIKNEYFHFIGHAAFVVPNSADNINLKFDIRWKNFPSSFKFANSFNSDSEHLWLQTNIGNLKQSVFLGGDYRLSKVTVNNQPLYIAMRGKWSFVDEEFFSAVRSVVEFQRNFWNDHGFPYFFVSLMPVRIEKGSMAGGTGLTNSFSMYVSEDLNLKNDIIPLLSHEHFHTWNGSKIHQVSPEELYYWFSEGFTSYYSRLFILRAGYMTLKEYVDDINRDIFDYSISPVKTAPNARIKKEFWKNEFIGKLPYYRGDLLALNWNTKIKQDSLGKRSLDDFMKAMYELSKTQDPAVDDKSVSELIRKDVPSVAADLRAYIWQGNMITPHEKALGSCVKREFISLGKFEHGFDADKTYALGVITGLKNGSPAHKAGLREGMKLLDRKMVYPPFSESQVKVLIHGEEKWLSFLPVSQKKHLMPHYILDEKMFKKDPKKCLDWFM